VFAARHEMAVTLDDVLAHHTRARRLARDASAGSVAELLGGVHGWSPEKRADQVAAYRDEIRT